MKISSNGIVSYFYSCSHISPSGGGRMKIPEALLNSTVIGLKISNLGICVIVNGNIWTIGWKILLHFSLVIF
jgi:hypothetical protein